MLSYDKFEEELNDLMDDVRDSVIQMTATQNAHPVLQKAAQGNYERSLQDVQKFVDFWSTH